jgi:phosphoglycolate phosphatase-like HAD superfamily hydrolase
MLVLFDIDGTLLLTDGAGRRAIEIAGRRIVTPDFSLDGVEIAGRLDSLIWADAAAKHGVEDPRAMEAEFRLCYAQCLAELFVREPDARALPGVVELLERLRSATGITAGLLTGNYPETGRIKLKACGLDPEWFPVAAWGCDGPSRRDLPRVAMGRYIEHVQRQIEPEEVVVIGDTPHDIDCAKVNGCRSIAVATGPSYEREELMRHEPDLLVDDLTDTEAVLEWMLRDAETGAASPR